ncbi:A/G-specific adenine glycosylase [Halodesulfovibrio sp. MK-HDV]|jgi:A/G-specific adenine glycosylase|uniref:A/G-specific adenine glycosylase n=1 Tax=Halodesulfovibrio sp. MK-HDV TaxID=2599925 RepID=UPI0013691FC2|nr:A/G-specific adenine glycosylase [Halodesulfovibrio sp. MK-HDV]KAF1076029.1 Adenine DNA glycosylase [Halodesulfovibrio sp. MK-HDV]
MISPDQYPAFSKNLLSWFSSNKRALPWREDYAPYRVWVSEIMLQQTQMERGVAYFHRWMQALPDVTAVAEAHEDTLLKLWEGLGYYSRVRNLHKAAKIIAAEHDGVFPEAHADIRALPGIGDYTAGAIASIAFNQDVICVDANVERVFSRIFDIDTPVKQKHNMAFIRETVAAMLPSGHAREFNQAIMELGALVCSKKPHCHRCPLQTYCEAYHLGIPQERPVPTAKKGIQHIDVATGFLMHKGKIYIQKRPNFGVWAGFWELPGGSVEEGEAPEEAVVREFMEETEFPVKIEDKIIVVKHGYTTYRVTMHCYFLTFTGEHTPEPVLHAATAYQWVNMDELDTVTLPAGHRKLLDHLQNDMRLKPLLENS